jgi:hypothetical protein
MGTAPLQIPRFDLPSTADRNEYLATMTHTAVDAVVEDTTAHWVAACKRLAADAEAQADDLIGPALNKET